MLGASSYRLNPRFTRLLFYFKPYILVGCSIRAGDAYTCPTGVGYENVGRYRRRDWVCEWDIECFLTMCRIISTCETEHLGLIMTMNMNDYSFSMFEYIMYSNKWLYVDLNICYSWVYCYLMIALNVLFGFLPFVFIFVIQRFRMKWYCNPCTFW